MKRLFTLFLACTWPLFAQPADTPPVAPAPDTPPAVEAPAAVEQETPPPKNKKKRANSSPHNERDRVTWGEKLTIAPNDWAHDAVSFFGSIHAEGPVKNSLVSIGGPAETKSQVGESMVVIGGAMRVDGEVKEAVCILGNVDLGPRARIGKLVVVGGRVTRDPAAVVDKEEVVMGVGLTGFDWGSEVDSVATWVREAPFKLRLLTTHKGTGWAWAVAGICLLFYLFIALVLGRGLNACAEQLEQRPGHVILTAFLTAILSPLLLVLLSITFVGPFIYLLLLVTAWMVGKAAFFNWLGRRVLKPLGLTHALLATLLGGALITLIYLVPVLSLLLWKLSGFLGVGMVVSAILASLTKNRVENLRAQPAAMPGAMPRPPVTPPVTLPATSAAKPYAAPETAAIVSPEAAPAFEPAVPPIPPPPAAATASGPAAAATASAQPAEDLLAFPRAGIGPRLGALLIDLLLVAVVSGLVPLVSFVPMFLAYSLVGWALRGTTVGGTLCRLQIVRLDRRPMDWPIAAVRTLGGVLSLLPFGYGFWRVDNDPERQTWHDQIAGTTVVMLPKARPLI